MLQYSYFRLELAHSVKQCAYLLLVIPLGFSVDLLQAGKTAS